MTSHNLILKTVTTLYYISISLIQFLSQDIQCSVIQDSPCEQWGFPQQLQDKHGQCSKTLSDNTETGSYLFQLLLTKIHQLSWSKSSCMLFLNHSFNLGSWQWKQSKVIVHVSWPDHIAAGLARRMDTTNSFTKNWLVKLIDRALECFPWNSIRFKLHLKSEETKMQFKRDT